MEIALHRDTNHKLIRADLWAEHLKAHGAEIRWVDLAAHDPFNQVKGCDGVMWYYDGRPEDKVKAYRIMHSIELYLGIPVFPDHYASWHYDDKLSVYHMLKAADVPMPQTWVFWDKDEAKEWARKTDYPKVFKLSQGAAAYNVTKVNDTNHACRLIDRMFGHGIFYGELEEPRVIPRNWADLKRFASRVERGLRFIWSGNAALIAGGRRSVGLEKGFVYFQEFIPHDFETRIYVIGDKIWASRKFSELDEIWVAGRRPGDYYDPSKIDLRCVQMAIDICRRLKFHSMLIDFLLRRGDPVVTDICYTVTGNGVDDKHKFPGRWDRNLNWIEGPTNRKEAEVEVFLERIRIRGRNLV